MRPSPRPVRLRLAAFRAALIAFLALAAAVSASSPASAQSVAETNLVASLVNSAESYLKEDKILLALDALVQAEKFKIPDPRLNETLARVIKRRKEMCDALLQKARMHLNDNDAKKAIAYLKEILDFWPDNEEVLKKLAELGVTVKQLTLKSQRYQKEDYSLLDDMRRQMKSVEEAMKELLDLEKARRIKEALAAAEGYFKKYDRHPALEIKLNLYRAAWAALAEYEKVRVERERGDFRGCAAAAARAISLDPAFRYGFLGLERDELATRLLFGGEAAVAIRDGSLEAALTSRLEELGRLGMAAYVTALAARRDGRYGDALKAFSSARLLSSPAEQAYMAIARLSALSFLAHYKSLLAAMAIQVAVFGFVAFRAFAFADLALDHEFSRFLFFAEREIGYYISRCGALVANGKWRKAERLARYILKRNPQVPQAHLWIGICRYRLGDKRQAMQIIGEFLKEAPRHPEANYYMGLLKDDYNMPREAIVHLELARGVSGAARKFKLEEITRKDDSYIGIFQEYKTAAAEMLGIRF